MQCPSCAMNLLEGVKWAQRLVLILVKHKAWHIAVNTVISSPAALTSSPQYYGASDTWSFLHRDTDTEESVMKHNMHGQWLAVNSLLADLLNKDTLNQNFPYCLIRSTLYMVYRTDHKHLKCLPLHNMVRLVLIASLCTFRMSWAPNRNEEIHA